VTGLYTAAEVRAAEEPLLASTPEGALMQRAATGLATIMSDAGLTNGAFYPHFQSKADLVRETVAAAEKFGELIACTLIEQNRFCPTLARAEHVTIRKAAARG